jgi:hypothetical protein
MACYDFDYALQMLCQAIDYAEIDHDFTPLRLWANEVEQSGHAMRAMDARLNGSDGQDFLLTTLQSVATGALSPEEAGHRTRRWLTSGQMQKADAEFVEQYQFA